MHKEEDRTSDHDRDTVGQKSECNPTGACDHEQRKTYFVLVPKQVNAQKSAGRGKPVDAVEIYCGRKCITQYFQFDIPYPGAEYSPPPGYARSAQEPYKTRFEVINSSHDLHFAFVHELFDYGALFNDPVSSKPDVRFHNCVDEPGVL